MLGRYAIITRKIQKSKPFVFSTSSSNQPTVLHNLIIWKPALNFRKTIQQLMENPFCECPTPDAPPTSPEKGAKIIGKTNASQKQVVGTNSIPENIAQTIMFPRHSSSGAGDEEPKVA